MTCQKELYVCLCVAVCVSPVYYVLTTGSTQTKTNSYLLERVFEQRLPRHGDLNMAGECVGLEKERKGGCEIKT